jgi:hypothetical protein
MRIVSLSDEVVHQIQYVLCASGGHPTTVTLDVTTGSGTGLPDDLDALLITSDLQGREAHSPTWPPRLLGEVLADDLTPLSELGVVPPPARLGVMLAGDFWADPASQSRGGLGDVTEVWRAFRRAARWAAGVAGNHDKFQADYPLKDRQGCYLLDGRCVSLDGLAVGGIGGIVGNSARPNRRSQQDYLDLLEEVLRQSPAVVVLHNGPDVPGAGEGLALIREVLLAFPPTLVVCGHCHWRRPLQELANGTQVLNVDGRAVLLRR